jgi:hypothetical protein
MVYVPPGVNTLVEIVTTCVAPASVGVMLNESGLADRPVTAGDGRLTVHVTAVVVPDVKVATIFGVVPAPAAIVALVGPQATV